MGTPQSVTAALLLLLSPCFGRAQEEAAAGAISESNLRAHVQFLASDDLEGRNSGYPGNEKAAEYIVQHFRSIGLEPGGDSVESGREYLQRFSFRDGGKTVVTANVVGVLRGTSAEIVVVGAHFDHVGRDGQWDAGSSIIPARTGGPVGEDDIWNGADDNASGTAAVMEIARVLAQGHYGLSRTVVFIAFSGEEYGDDDKARPGSDHYVNHSYGSLADHVAMFNMDMVGRSDSGVLQVEGVATWGEWRGMMRVANGSLSLPLLPAGWGNEDSDHFAFHAERIPYLSFFDGKHRDYHRATDHADRLDYRLHVKVTQLVTRLVCTTARSPVRPQWPPKGKATVDLFGVDGKSLSETEAPLNGIGYPRGGFRVEFVIAGSVADQAGLLPCDIVTECNGKALSLFGAYEDLVDALTAVPVATDVPVEVLRDGERKTLIARWE